MDALRGLPFLLRPGMTVALTPPALKRDRFTQVLDVTDTGAGHLVSFSGISTITDAEEVAGCMVLADEATLELDPLCESIVRLEGRPVIDERYGELGEVVDILEYPANDVWVVRGPRGEVLIPVILDVIDHIPHDGPITVHVMDGLIDSAEE